jgi:hypothetical protein
MCGAAPLVKGNGKGSDGMNDLDDDELYREWGIER